MGSCRRGLTMETHSGVDASRMPLRFALTPPAKATTAPSLNVYSPTNCDATTSLGNKIGDIPGTSVMIGEQDPAPITPQARHLHHTPYLQPPSFGFTHWAHPSFRHTLAIPPYRYRLGIARCRLLHDDESRHDRRTFPYNSSIAP